MTIHIKIEDVDKVDIVGMLTERCKQYNLVNGMTEDQWDRLMNSSKCPYCGLMSVVHGKCSECGAREE